MAFLVRDLAYQAIDISLVNSELEMQGILIKWNRQKVKIFNMYLPPNQGNLPESLLEHGPDDASSIFLGDLNAKHHSWGCSSCNDRGRDLLKVVDDESLMFINDGSPTHFSFSYNTAEALDISIVSADLYPKSRWTVLNNIGSDHLPVLIEIGIKQVIPDVKENFWNFRKADWKTFADLTERIFGDGNFGDDLETNWKFFKDTVISAAKKSIPRGNFKRPRALYSYGTPNIAALIENF